jgi:hypothetical protein
MINRRRLLLGGLGVIGVAGLGAWGFGRMAFEAEVASILRRRLSFLKLDRDGVRAFAKDQATAAFTKKIPTWNRLRYHFGAVGPSFNRYYRSNDKRSRVSRLEDSLISTYLLSSDFFLNGADESRTVNYVAFYDAMRPCQNPFARPVPAASATS